MKSQLSIHPLGELIREISASRLSGVLRLMRERVKVLVYFDAGEVADARSNLRPHRLAECLARWGAGERAAALDERMTDEEAYAALASSGAATAEEVASWRARQAEDVLRTPLLWADGEWSFDPDSRPLTRPARKLDARPLLLEAARRLPKEFTAGRLTNDEETFSPATDPPAHLPLQPAEGFVLSRVDAPRRLGELVAVSGLPESDTRQALYALALCGLVVRERWPVAIPPHAIARAQAQAPAAEEKSAAESPAEPKEADPREEMRALFARAEANNYYQVLGVARQAPAADIKRAYYALAKRFHPDRFRRDLSEDERARVDAAFARISQAYETLKDPAQRANYDLKADSRASVRRGEAPTAAKSSGESPQFRAEDNFRRGTDALRQGDRMQAVIHFAEAARLMPREARYRALYGHALAGDPATRRQAESELKAAISLDGDNAQYRVMLALVYRDLGMRLRAEGELQRALSVDPGSVEARRLLDSLQKQ